MTRKVLQLLGTYEPDGVIDPAHAVVLVNFPREASGKIAAQVVEPDPTGAVMHSSTRIFQVPSVILLTTCYDLRRKRQESGKQRGRIFIRDRFRCQYCAKRFQACDLTLDHIDPRSKGGLDDPENLATSCKPCNQRKANRTPDEARMPLLSTPSALRYGLDKAMLRHYAEDRPEWAKWLEPWIYVKSKVA